MKRALLLLCFLPWVLSASSQEPSDSLFWDAEMEDSISAIAIKPIKRPKKLLDSIIGQVILDSEQNPLVCKYRTACTTGLHTSSPTTSSCILHAIANIQVKSTGKGEEFRYDGPRRLTNLHDTASVYSALKSCLDGDYMLGLVQKCADETSVFQSFKYLMSLHHIKVYSISDEKGRGIYRIHLDERKPERQKDLVFYNNHKMKWYLDSQSLCIKQINSYSSGNRYQTIYRHDFEEENGSPILSRAVEISAWGGNVMHKVTITLIEE